MSLPKQYDNHSDYDYSLHGGDQMSQGNAEIARYIAFSSGLSQCFSGNERAYDVQKFIEKFEAHMLRVTEALDAKDQRIKELEKELKYLKEHTHCSYCDFEAPVDIDASIISEHIRTCSNHPMSELQAKVKELEKLGDTLRISDRINKEIIKSLQTKLKELKDIIRKWEQK